MSAPILLLVKKSQQLREYIYIYIYCSMNERFISAFIRPSFTPAGNIDI